MIGIVDYKTANLGSLINICKRLAIASRVVSNPSELAKVDRIILPGIGHFDTCARNLRNSGFVSALQDLVLHEEGLPILGICVGAQLITRGSEEGNEPGLGWIDASTKRFPMQDDSNYKVPHMGWNLAYPARPHPLFKGFGETTPRFYFVHSYFMQCDRAEASLARSVHGIEFDCAIGRGNIAGVQFHPEKSHKFGMKLLSAFASWDPRHEVEEC